MGFLGLERSNVGGDDPFCYLPAKVAARVDKCSKLTEANMKGHGSAQCSSFYNIYQEPCRTPRGGPCANRNYPQTPEPGYEKTFLEWNDLYLEHFVDVVRPCRARSRGYKTRFMKFMNFIGKDSLCKKDEDKKCPFQIDNPANYKLALQEPYGTSKTAKKPQRAETREHLKDWHERMHD